MRIHFMLQKRAQGVMNPVLVEAFAILRRRGFEVSAGIAEEMVQRSDELRVEHDLYILKSHTELSLSVAGILHAQGARLLNPYTSCAATQDKIVVSRMLRAAGIPAPDSWITGDLALLQDLVRDRPLIVKPYKGFRGQGITVARDVETLISLGTPETPMIVQEYLPGAGEDLKVYVIGEEVFAVRKPFSATSFAVPGRPCPVSPQVRDIALRCGRAFGLGFYGLDLIENAAGLWVVDLNYDPGYKGVPGAGPLLADYIERYANGPDSLDTLRRFVGPAIESRANGQEYERAN